MNVFKVAAFQGPLFYGQMHRALEAIVALLSRADQEGVDVLCMPEGYLQGYFSSREEAWQNSIDLASEEFKTLCKQFASFKTTLVLGLNERDQDHLYDTAVVIEEGKFKG